MIVDEKFTAVLNLSDVLADQHVQSLQVGSFIDDYLVFTVS